MVSGFRLGEDDGATIVTAVSTFRPNNVLVRAILPLIRRGPGGSSHADDATPARSGLGSAPAHEGTRDG
jgi:hypothetical protein